MAPLTIDPSGPPNGIALGPGAGTAPETFSATDSLVLITDNPMPLTDQIKNYAKKLVENRPDPSALRSWSVPASHRPSAFVMTALSRTIRAFRFFCTAA